MFRPLCRALAAPTTCPHRPEAQDVALSRPKHGFESRWGRHFNASLPSYNLSGGCCACDLVPVRLTGSALLTQVSVKTDWFNQAQYSIVYRFDADGDPIAAHGPTALPSSRGKQVDRSGRRATHGAPPHRPLRRWRLSLPSPASSRRELPPSLPARTAATATRF